MACVTITLALLSHAEEPITALSGSIFDEKGGPIIAAKLTLRGGNSQLYLTKSSERGTFRFARMGAGSYTLSIDQAGFCPLQIRDIAVSAGAENTLPRIVLPVAPEGQNCPQ